MISISIFRCMTNQWGSISLALSISKQWDPASWLNSISWVYWLQYTGSIQILKNWWFWLVELSTYHQRFERKVYYPIYLPKLCQHWENYQISCVYKISVRVPLEENKSFVLTLHYYKDLSIHWRKWCCWQIFWEPILYPVI